MHYRLKCCFPLQISYQQINESQLIKKGVFQLNFKRVAARSLHSGPCKEITEDENSINSSFLFHRCRLFLHKWMRARGETIGLNFQSHTNAKSFGVT